MKNKLGQWKDCGFAFRRKDVHTKKVNCRCKDHVNVPDDCVKPPEDNWLKTTFVNPEKLKIETPFKLIKEGLKHTQKVYKGVYEFTNLVKKDALMTKTECNIKEILTGFLSTTAYSSQVILDNSLPTIMVNEALFCTSIDNLIRNGLRYNDSNTRFVKVYSDDPNRIIIQDNGRGMSQDEFLQYSKPYMRKEGQLETGTGLGLNISVVILEEHGFKMMSEKLDIGTKIIITLNNEK